MHRGAARRLAESPGAKLRSASQHPRYRDGGLLAFSRRQGSSAKIYAAARAADKGATAATRSAFSAREFLLGRSSVA